MKKKCTLISVVLAGIFCAGITSCDKDKKGDNPTPNVVNGYFAENFDGIGLGLSSWKQINDQNKVNPYYKGEYDQAWIAKEFSLYNGNTDNKMAVSCAWFEPRERTADRWLISPSFEVKGDDPHLYWEECTPDPEARQSYRLVISPNGGAEKNDFTEVAYEIPQGENGSTINAIREISLKKLKGKTIRIAFVNDAKDKGFLLAIDNIFLSPTLVKSVANNMDQKRYDLTEASASFMGFPKVEGAEYEVNLLPVNKIPGKDQGQMFTTNGLSVNFTGLKAGTRYHGYLRSKGSIHWVGPYPIQTSTSLPFQTEFNGNLIEQGYKLVDAASTENSPLNDGSCVVVKTILDDYTLAQVKTPPLKLEANKKMKVSFDYYIQKSLGSIGVWIESFDENDQGSMLLDLDLSENPTPENKKVHFEQVFNTSEYTDSYRVIVRYSYPFGEEEFKFYLDNLKIEYAD